MKSYEIPIWLAAVLFIFYTFFVFCSGFGWTMHYVLSTTPKNEIMKEEALKGVGK